MAENDFDLVRRLESLEKRLSQLESLLEEGRYQKPFRTEESITVTDSNLIGASYSDNESRGLESQIGRIGLSWLGITVLLVGIIFLTEYLKIHDKNLLSVIIGYLSATALYLLWRNFSKQNSGLSAMFFSAAQVILFYVTLRLHFFSADPLLVSKALSLILLMLICSFEVLVTIRRSSQSHGHMTIMFILITALVSDSVHPMLILTVVAAGLALYLYFRFRWQSLMVFTIILAYLAIFLWLFGNPIMGNTFAIIKQHNGAHVYFLLTGAIFSLLPLLRNENGSDDDFIITAVVIHGLLFTMMLLPFTLGFFRDSYVYLYILLSASCLGYSIFLRYASSWIFPSAFFALYGFMALSIALYGLTGFPVVYLLLAVQSLIVVSMALWFRNRLMIILNTLLFVFIYVLYMISSKPVDGVNFAFAAASLVSARIINWKRERLNIKTELIRNTYLICGFIMVLFALFKAVPGQFVSLSWTLAALSYFLLSFVLRNVKYRYMALGTLISAAIYLFIVDLARIELIYRVLALLSFAIVSIGISIYYSNRSGKNEKAENKI